MAKQTLANAFAQSLDSRTTCARLTRFVSQAAYPVNTSLIHAQVESFVNAVVRETIPNDFWGSKANADLIFGCSSPFSFFEPR